MLQKQNVLQVVRPEQQCPRCGRPVGQCKLTGCRSWIDEQEGIGYASFYKNVGLADLANEYQRRGWNDAMGFECHMRAMEREEAMDATYRRWGMG